ncbi:hypothetical protein DFH06DRAFT_1339623 [Mycena polygramma]|nr:hypothetical protein DFH06DRAFT_1339623 [Mycena polygramma]
MATLCDLPISTGFDSHSAASYLSRDWVVKSGLSTRDSQISGLLTLPSDVGVISLRLNNVSVTDSLSADLLLGLDWFHFARFSAPELVVHLDSGSLDLRHPLTHIGPFTVTPAVTPGLRGSARVEHSSLPSVSLGNSDVLLQRMHPGHPVRGGSKHLAREVLHP